MSRLFPVSRWLVVDDSPDDIDDIVLAIEGLGGKVDTADSIKAAEKLLKKNIYDVCIIDCFYKGSTKWGVDLLPELRATLPGLPVVMTSSSDDLELPGKVIRAGADVFCPKLKDSFSLTKTLGVAALQAIALRKLKILEFDPRTNSELYISKATLDAFEHSTRRKEERLLICGASGTGKTKTAQFFAHQFLKQNYGTISRNIVYHNCSSKNEEATAQLLFGSNETHSSSSSPSLQLTLFERAVGGVLILDDIHALSTENQNKLKNIFDSESITSTLSEGALPLSLIKCVATCSTDSEANIVPGFLESYAHREIDLPSISDLGSDLPKIIKFIFDQFFSENKEIQVTYNTDVITRILDLTSTHSFSANFRTLNQIIQSALTHALADGRSQIYPSDIEIIGILKSGTLSQSSSKPIPGKLNCDVLEGRFGEQLLKHIANGENFDEAKDILRKIMINIASKKFGGNKSKIAAALGISRQSLYDHEELE
ncbi:MAG: sigma 54-interacting transcriptional regulator [Bdellovibrionota bacterium]